MEAGGCFAVKKKRWVFGILLSVFLLVVVIFLAVCTVPFLFHRGKIGPDVFYAFNRITGTVVVYGTGNTYFCQPTYICDSGTMDADDERWGSTFTDQSGETHTYPEDPHEFRHPLLMAEAEQAPLRKVIVLRGVTGLDSGTFRECHDLRAIYLPDTLEYVGIYPFYDLKDVTIYFPSDAPPMTHVLIGESTGVTIVHRPGTTGWDQEILRYYAGDEYPEYSVVERNYIVNWLPFGR